MGQMSGIMRGASGGISRLAAALGGGDLAEQQAQQKAMEQQSRIGLALSQMRAHDAQAGLEGAKAAGINARPGQFEEQVALASGVDIPTLRSFRSALAGQLPQVPMGPETADGQMGIGSEPLQMDDGTRSKIAQAMQRLLPVANGGADNAEHWSKALGAYRNMDLGDQVMNGQRTAGAVGAAQAAMEGKPLMHANEFGSTDLFTGAVNDQTGPAQRFSQYRTAETGKAKAQTGQANAAAANSYASAALHKAQANEVTNGPKGQLVQTDQGPVFANPRDGSSVPVLNQDGTPAGAKLKDIPPTVAAKIMEGRQSVSNLDNAIAAVKKNPGAFGFVNGIPYVERLRQGDEQGVDARAQVANIGSLKLHDRSGAAVSASEFPRLAPFIPSSSDNPVAIVRKLEKMKEIAQGEMGLFADFYGPNQGYKAIPMNAPKPAAPGQPRAPREGGATGSWGDAPDGGGWKIERVN